MKKQIVLTINIEDGLDPDEQETYVNNLVAAVRNKNLSFFFMKGLKYKSKVLRDVILSGWEYHNKK